MTKSLWLSLVQDRSPHLHTHTHTNTPNKTQKCLWSSVIFINHDMPLASHAVQQMPQVRELSGILGSLNSATERFDSKQTYFFVILISASKKWIKWFFPIFSVLKCNSRDHISIYGCWGTGHKISSSSSRQFLQSGPRKITG